MDDIEGYEIPIHKSLTTPILIMGVPRIFALMNGTFLAVMTLAFQTLYGIPICFILHLIVSHFTAKDEQAVEIILRGMKHKTFYRV